MFSTWRLPVINVAELKYSIFGQNVKSRESWCCACFYSSGHVEVISICILKRCIKYLVFLQICRWEESDWINVYIWISILTNCGCWHLRRGCKGTSLDVVVRAPGTTSTLDRPKSTTCLSPASDPESNTVRTPRPTHTNAPYPRGESRRPATILQNRNDELERKSLASLSTKTTARRMLQTTPTPPAPASIRDGLWAS